VTSAINSAVDPSACSELTVVTALGNRDFGGMRRHADGLIVRVYRWLMVRLASEAPWHRRVGRDLGSQRDRLLPTVIIRCIHVAGASPALTYDHGVLRQRTS